MEFLPVTGNVTGTSPLEVSVNGVAATVSDGGFSAMVPLVLGANTLTATAANALGNATDSVAGTRAVTGPPLSITIQTPPNGALVSSAVISVAGDVSDPAGLVAVNGSYGTVTGGAYVAAAVYLAEGPNTIVATATRGTETVSAEVSITYNAPPKVVITSPAAGARYRSGATDVEGRVDDAAAFVDVNGVTATVGPGGSFVARGVPLAPGDNTLLARAIDGFGAKGTDSVAVVRDDGAAGRIRLVVIDDNNRWMGDAGRMTFSDLHEWDENLEVGNRLSSFPRPFDVSRGRMQSAFTDPIVFPQLELLVLAEDGGDVTLEAFGEGEAAPRGGPVTLEPLPIEELPNTEYLPGLALPQALETPDFTPRWFAIESFLLLPCIPDFCLPDAFADEPIRIRATVAGIQKEITLSGDVTKPAVEITSPLAGSVIAGDTVTVTGTVRDANALLDAVGYEVRDDLGALIAQGTVPLLFEEGGSGDPLAANGRFAIPDLPLGAGFHTIRVRAWDALGAYDDASSYVETDPAAPAVTLIEPRDGSARVEDSVAVSLNFSAPTTIVAVNGVPDGRSFPVGLAPDALLAPLALGANVFVLDLESEGRLFSFSYTLHRVAQLGGVRIATPSAGSTVNQDPLTVTGTVPLGTPAVEVNGILATLAPDGVSFSAQVPIPHGTGYVLVGSDAVPGPLAITATALPLGATASVDVVPDFVPPVVREIVPGDQTITLEPTLVFTGFVSEASTITLSGGASSVTTTTVRDRAREGREPLNFFNANQFHRFTLSAVGLAFGENTLTLRAVDAAGNASEVPVTLRRQESALELVSPAAGDSVPGLLTNVTLNALGAVTIDAFFVGAYRLDGVAPLAIQTGALTVGSVPLRPGPNEIRVVYHREGAAQEVLASTITSTATNAATVSGRVTDQGTGAPIGGALVAIAAGGSDFTVVTAADGSFEAAVAPGSVNVTATAEGFAVQTLSLTASAGGTATANAALASTGLPSLMNEVRILVPPEGTVTDFETLTVVGNVLNAASQVTVNGVAAEVIGHRFTARHVPLAMGANTLTVTATAPGALAVTTSVAVERSDTPVLAVKLFSPPDGATIPGGGLVVRGFVSAKAARTLAGDSFVTVEEGVFEADDVPVSAGASSVVAVSRLSDGAAASHAVSITAGSASNALSLAASPLEGPPPLRVQLGLRPLVALPALERIDFDLDGDRIADVLAAPVLTVEADYSDARPYVARAYVTLPNGAELSARARIAVRPQPMILREFASGNPVDLATDADGRLHVLDAAAGHVTVYDTAGNVDHVIGSSGSGLGQLASPQGVAVGPDGRIYVADTGNARVQVFESGGAFVQSINGAPAGSGLLNAPRSVAVSEDEILVVEAGTRARRFSLDGKELGAVDASSLRGAGWVSGHGLLVASPSDKMLGSASGALRSVALSETARERLAAPIDVAGGEDGVWVADAATSSVIGLTDHLGYRRTIGGFARPPLSVASGGRAEMESIFVADGEKVLEVGLPVPSPLPVVEELKSRLLAGDVAGALARIHPLQRALFEQIYADLGAGLSASGARMEAFTLERVRERGAIVRIRATLMENGSPRTIQHPMHLVRAEDGTWQVFDY